tara:strand:- start:412 stop:681 length:270 start_codon:yes stop_codon:yes gene_type:complete
MSVPTLFQSFVTGPYSTSVVEGITVIDHVPAGVRCGRVFEWDNCPHKFIRASNLTFKSKKYQASLGIVIKPKAIKQKAVNQYNWVGAAL